MENQESQSQTRLGRPRAVRQTLASAQRPTSVPVLRITGQVRDSKQAQMRLGTAFDASSRSWMPLRPGPGGSFSVGLGQPQEEAPPPAGPPPGGTAAGPEPEPSVSMSRSEAEMLVAGIDEDLAAVISAREADLSELCPAIDHRVLADLRAFRARLAQELEARDEEILSARPREIHAAAAVSDCAVALGAKKKGPLVIAGAAALALVIVVALSV